jgi:hypothetical protein
MRRTLAVALILGAAWAAVAAADGGGPSPGPSWGQPGKLDPTGTVRYVTVDAGARATVLEAIRLRDGSVLRWTSLQGMLGIPMVAWNRSTGGLSRDGRNLVLESQRGPRWTTFVLVDPVSMRVRTHVRLRGTFGFDALSPDGSVMYLIENLGSPYAATQPYSVRAFNWDTLKLYPGAIVDRREPDEKMNGQPMARTGNAAGWAYTLYMRPGQKPFVHALDTVHRRAFCVDLPWRNSDNWIWTVKLRLSGTTLALRRDGKVLARLDTKTLEVSS